jgi:hypothetical protein
VSASAPPTPRGGSGSGGGLLSELRNFHPSRLRKVTPRDPAPSPGGPGGGGTPGHEAATAAGTPQQPAGRPAAPGLGPGFNPAQALRGLRKTGAKLAQ